MRSALLIFATFGLIFGIFIGYTLLQTGQTVVHSPAHTPTTGPLPDASRQAIVGEGEDAWVEMRDANWKVISRFKASRYEPRQDGRVEVTDPEAVFFMADGQRLRIRGRTGIVTLPQLPAAGEDPRNLGPRQAPSRGELRDVQIELYPSQQAMQADADAAATELLKLTLDNASFDNETYHIYTADTQIDGQPVARDRVPVVMVGRDYDFSGEGLTIRWNEKLRRLDLLEIAHGGKLVIKNPDAMPMLRQAQVSRLPLASQFAEAQPVAVAQTLADAQAKASYRASFNDDVRIFEDQLPVAVGDELFIDFAFASTDVSQERPAATKPDALTAPAPSTAPIGPVQPPSNKSNPSTNPASPSKPLTVRWNGALVVTPLPEAAPTPATGAATVHLIGSPLRITQEKSQLSAKSLVYDTAARTLDLDGSAAYPLVMKDADGATIQSEAMQYDAARQLVSFRGQSRALLPMRGKSADAPEAVLAQWSGRCDLQLSGDGLKSLAAKQADISGSVRIRHPAISLDADQLQIMLDQSADASMPLTALTATGGVHCEVIGADKTPQSIDSAKLMLTTAIDPAGRRYIHRIEADQNVVAQDKRQSIRAGHLTATLLPPQAGERTADEISAAGFDRSVGLEQFVAVDGAEYTTDDGKRAAADQIEVIFQNEQPLVSLLGSAQLGDGTNTLFGPQIHLSAAEQKATVVGGGSMEALRPAEGESPPRPVSVEWKKGIVADGKSDQIAVSGDVVVTTSERDGTIVAISADQLLMKLTDDPAQKARKKAPVDRPLLQGKLAQSVTLSGQTQVRALRTAEDGSILRRFNLTGQTLVYDLQSRMILVPVAGRLLFEDHPARDVAAPKIDQPALAGATAMKWNHQLRYDLAAGEVKLDGEVLIVQEAEAQAKGFRLSASTVTATLSTADASNASQAAARDLKKLTAEGSVHFVADALELRAGRVDYEPQSTMLTASGSGRHPVEILNGLSRGSFGQARFNLQTNQLQVTDFKGQSR